MHVALSCLNYGRCTLSAGMLGGARRAFDQATKWSQHDIQFQRPLADFELVAAKIARMSALTYAMDAVLYLTTAMLDRHDEDIMLETAICKLFCSEMGWRVVNDAMQIMGGEGYMTENQIEHLFRDSPIQPHCRGRNEVMQSFIFAYGGNNSPSKCWGFSRPSAGITAIRQRTTGRISQEPPAAGCDEGGSAAGGGIAAGSQAARTGDPRREIPSAHGGSAGTHGSRA